VEGGRITGVICDTKSGREAVLGDVVIDATGDLDVAASAGAPHIGGAYMLTTVFRLGNVDCDAAERFEHEHPAEFARLDKESGLLGRSIVRFDMRVPGRMIVRLPRSPGQPVVPPPPQQQG